MAPMLKSKLDIRACYNPSCDRFARKGEKAPLKCAKCRTAHYCDKDCQRAHWPAHKENCHIWSSTAAVNDNISIVAVKAKMAELLWHTRSTIIFVEEMFSCYGDQLSNPSAPGCMEYLFMSFQELFEAVEVLESLPIVAHKDFRAIAGTPSAKHAKDGTQIPQKIPIRVVPKSKQDIFNERVKYKMAHIVPTSGTRPNMESCMWMVRGSQKRCILCVTVKLEGERSTQSFDFMYRGLSYDRNDVPSLDDFERRVRR